MVFSKPAFRKEEETEWEKANDAGKELLLLEPWFEEMLREGVAYYSRPKYSVDLTPKKMETVKQADPATLGVVINDPFERYKEVDDKEGLIGTPQDAKEVIQWAEQNPCKVAALQSKLPEGYLSSKFRFYRRLHLWMEKTAQKICEYQEAKEVAKVCGCWGDEHFSFRDFIGNHH